MSHLAPRSGSGRVAAPVIWIVVAAVATSSCGDRSPRPGAEGGGAEAEVASGPHGGRWLADGDFAVELLLYEDGGPAELRAWVFADGAPRDPEVVSLEVTLRRLGGRVVRIGFVPRGDHLAGDAPVKEPHSFDVEVLARADGHEYRFAYSSYAGRVVLDPEQIVAAGIVVATAGPAEVSERAVLNGRVEPDENALARIAPRFPGVLRSVHKRLGDLVEPGDLLAVVESNESLRPYELRASLAGTVIARAAAPGEFVDGDRVVLVTADLSEVWVDLAVHRPDFDRVRVGQPVRIDAGPDAPEAVTVISYVSPIGSPGTQTLLARAVLPNPDRAWRPGLFVTGAVETARRQAPVTVAPEAIQRWRDGDAIFLAESGVFEAQPVLLGARDGARVEVLEGLEPGQRYVAAGSFVVKAEAGKAVAAHDH